jgi:hypothetical protein
MALKTLNSTCSDLSPIPVCNFPLYVSNKPRVTVTVISLRTYGYGDRIIVVTVDYGEACGHGDLPLVALASSRLV